MITDKFGQLIFNENDICNLLMQGRDVATIKNMIVDESVDINLTSAATILENIPAFIKYNGSQTSIEEFDQSNQITWRMPDEYKQFDIADYVLGLCNSEAELQRCGAELLLFQERGLFDLLKYLKYLVDTMIKHNIIWGVGRGSSVSSYVLYKLGVHRIDSLYYNLDVAEFLR